MELSLLIGIPGSGKSTFARGSGKRSVSPDAIRRKLYGDASILGKSSEVDRELRRQLERLAGAGCDVIIDATHTSRSRRTRTIRLAQRLGYDRVVGIWFQTPLRDCLERNRRRSRRVPEFVLFNMQRALDRQPPSLDEGFDALQIVVS